MFASRQPMMIVVVLGDAGTVYTVVSVVPTAVSVFSLNTFAMIYPSANARAAALGSTSVVIPGAISVHADPV
jgi:hypothetical protein